MKKQMRAIAIFCAAVLMTVSATACGSSRDSSDSSSASKGNYFDPGTSSEDIIKAASAAGKIGNWGIGNEYELLALLTKYDLPNEFVSQAFDMDSLPKLAIVDASLSESMPQSVTAATGLDALTHAIEAYTSKQAQPLTDALTISAVKRIFQYLPLAYQDGKNRKAREEMAAAALEAGICINNSSVTIVHGMSRPIGALFHVPHGLSNAMLLEKCLQFALPGCCERFGALGRVIGAAPADSTDSEAADALLEAVKLLCHTCEVPSPEQYGIAKTAFFNAVEKMAADAITSGSPGNTGVK